MVRGTTDELAELAAARLQERDYDGVADAVERLVDGREARAEAFDLGRSLINPLVRSRLVQRLGAEKDEEMRARGRGIFLALGEEIQGKCTETLAKILRRGVIAGYEASSTARRNRRLLVYRMLREPSELVFAAARSSLSLGNLNL